MSPPLPHTEPAAERGRRRRLVLLGVALAILLPILCVGLLVKEFLRIQDQTDAHAVVLIDGVEKQLRDRLFLLSAELDALALSPDPASLAAAAERQPIPLRQLRVEARAPEAGMGPDNALWLGPPTREGSRWWVPVGKSMGDGEWLRAEVDAALFAQVVADYSLPAGETLRLLHADGILLAPQMGRDLQRSPLFSERSYATASGSYAGTGVDGKERQMHFRRLPEVQLVIEVGIARYAVLRQWAPFALTLLTLALLLALSWAWVVRQFDRTQRRQQALISQLDASRRHLREAHAMAHMGEWSVSMEDKRVHWSEEVSRIYGREPGDGPLDVEAVIAMIHPEDVARLLEDAARMSPGTGAMHAEFRVLRPDGEQRYLQADAELQVDADGSRWLRGVQQDITEIAAIQQRLGAAESQYRFLFEHNPLPMWVFDLETLEFLAVNDAMQRHYGYDRSRLLAMNLLDIRPAEDAEAARKAVQDASDQRTPGAIWTHLRSDGTPLRMATQSHDIEFEGRPARLVAAQDVTERERAEQRLQLVTRATSDALWDWDLATGHMWRSDSFFSRFGYGKGNIEPTIAAWEACVHADDVARVTSGLDLALQSGQEEWQATYRFRREDGTYVEVLDRGFILRDVARRALRVVGGMLDLTQSLRDQSDLRLLRRAVDSTANGIVIADARQPDHPVVFVNRGFEEITGYLASDIVGRNCRILQGVDHAQPAIDSLRLALAEGTEARELLRNYRADGTLFYNEFLLSPVRDEQGDLTHFIGVINDVTQRHHYEEQLAHRATHDELTGLPNRQLLHDRLHQAILNADRYDRQAGVVFIDLDDFKLVNDNLGHGAGDEVLRIVAQRLRGAVRDTDTVGRFGGDEFVVVLTEQTDEAGMARVIGRVTAALSEPMDISGLSHTLTPSIGWCRYPDAGTNAESLLMHADVAMYQAKRGGRNRAVAYRAEFDTHASQRLRLIGELREALRLKQFELVFQPLFAREGEVVALEALVRWQHPERGLLAPADFVGVCEEAGLIVELGRRVLLEAARHHRMLVEAGLGRLRIAVNVSSVQFEQGLADDVRAALEAYSMPPGTLELELTESVIMHSPERAVQVMRQLAEMGVSFSLDDFGTGHSSLAYLQRLPIHRLKIDRSFVKDLRAGSGDAMICASMIGLAHSLNLTTVAEGVETQDQLDWLRAQGCDEIQGYLLCRPLGFDALLPVLLGGDPGMFVP